MSYTNYLCTYAWEDQNDTVLDVTTSIFTILGNKARKMYLPFKEFFWMKSLVTVLSWLDNDIIADGSIRA